MASQTRLIACPAPGGHRSARGQYIRDTFITLALSAGEDPGWVACVCGTSEAMILRHYRSWMAGLDQSAGHRVAALLAEHPARPSRASPRKQCSEFAGWTVEAAGIEPA